MEGELTMVELTITVTINVPDDKDDISKLIALIRHADYTIAEDAKDRITRMDRDIAILEASLLRIDRPDSYQRGIIKIDRDVRQWIEARNQALLITSAVTYQLIQHRAEAKKP